MTEKWCEIVCKNTGHKALVSEEDFGYLSKWNWYQSSSGYACRNVNTGKKTFNISMARTIVGLSHNDERQVDHVNGNRMDNRRDNLRICTPQENVWNMKKFLRKKQSSVLYKGVYLKPETGLWRARVRYNGKDIHCGYWNTEEEAAKAYDQKAKELFGEFAKLNFDPRPAPKKTMGEELRHVYQNSIFISENQAWDRVASRAKELILDGKEYGVDKIILDCLSKSESRRDLVNKILTYLRESC